MNENIFVLNVKIVRKGSKARQCKRVAKYTNLYITNRFFCTAITLFQSGKTTYTYNERGEREFTEDKVEKMNEQG